MASRKLLLADDSITIQKVVNLTFAEEGIEVVTVGDGDSALARISEEWPDLIMADVNMPGASGYQICESVRANKATEDIPVVLLVGSFEPFDEEEARRVGANAFLTKPFQSIRQLVSQVTELIETRTGTDEDSDPAGELEATVNGHPTDDIEALYSQSMDPTASQAAPETDYSISDQGLDDEMIETQFVEGETVEFGVAAPEPELPPVAEGPAEAEETEVAHEAGSTEPHQEWVEPGQETAPQALETDAGATSIFGDVDSEDEAETIQRRWAQPDDEAGFATERATESESIDAPAEEPSDEPTQEFASAEYPETLESQVFSPEPAQPAEPAPWESPADDSSAAHDSVFTDPLASIEDIDLLELPPVSEEPTIEFTTPEQAAEAGSRRQVVSLSDELIEIIATRVAEKLSRGH